MKEVRELRVNDNDGNTLLYADLSGNVLIEAHSLKIKDKDVIYIKPEIKCLIKYLERTENGLLRQPFVP